MPESCPCGSGRAFAACCRPFHDGAAPPTAEALMRSRYAAYVLGDGDYLRATWLDGPAEPSVGDTAWLGLSIVRCVGGDVADEEGMVEFVAAFRDGSRVMGLCEASRFLRLDGRWRYAGGEARVEALGRNVPCPCGSGRKLKHCCARRG